MGKLWKKNFKYIFEFIKSLNAKIFVITDHFGPHTGGAHAAVSSTVYQLLKLGLKIKLIYSKDNFNKRNNFLLIKNSDIVHFLEHGLGYI